MKRARVRLLIEGVTAGNLQVGRVVSREQNKDVLVAKTSKLENLVV